MSRLYDRVTTEGCRPMTLRDVYASAPPEPWEHIIAEVLAEEGREVTPEAVRQRKAGMYADARELVSSSRFDSDAFDDAVVVSAEDVASYWSLLPVGTDMLDLLDVLVPPYERLFVEFQGQPNIRNVDLNSWGVLIEGGRVEGERLVGGGGKSSDRGDCRWLVVGSLARLRIPQGGAGRPHGQVVRSARRRRTRDAR